MSLIYSPGAIYRGVPHIPELDSLRGIAIILVIAFHFLGIIVGPAPFPPDSSWLILLVSAGHLGVDLFFVLSGFLLSRPFFDRQKPVDIATVVHFWKNRLVRILPLYYVGVFAAYLVCRDLDPAVRALVFIPPGFELYPFGLPWWTLSTEMQFYLALPIAFWLTARQWGRLLVGASLVFFVSYHVLLSDRSFFDNAGWFFNANHSFLVRGTPFLLGVLLAWFFFATVAIAGGF